MSEPNYPKLRIRECSLYETFIAACYEKADEIDDSSGSFGALVDDLFCGWIKARQAAGMDPDETVRLLPAWMEEDTYGFCYDIEKEAVKVLDRRGLDAFARRLRGSRNGPKEANHKPQSGPIVLQS